MKKNMVRIVALLLVAMLALTLLPLGALAANDIPAGLDKWYTEDSNLEIKDGFFDNAYCFDHDDLYIGDSSVTIKTSSYDELIKIDGDLYDIDQFYLESYDLDKGNFSLSAEGSSIKIPGAPSDPEEYGKWYHKYWWVHLGYTPHKHSLTGWISDGTTHWKNCTVCREKFIHQNWCQDGDEDRICNVCGGDVPYHDITVIESEGGKITVNKDLASHRTKITADVDVADGYKLKKLHFTKIRDDGSRQEITRYKKDGQFWTRMPTYELEVSAEFVKK